MLKLLQKESQQYFNSKSTLAEIFNKLSNRKQRVNYYIMLILQQLPSNVEVILQHLGETSTNHTIDVNALLTAVWGLSIQYDQKGEDAKKLFNLVALVHARNIVDKSQLLSELPEWVTNGAGIMQQTAFDKKIARVYTKINYEQSKYSLLRQNNEGYAKISLLLINLRDNHDIQAVWKKIVSLVGNFDLDPDRLLDLIVQARIQNHNTDSYIHILNNFRRESITVTLGNKIKMIKGKPIQASIFEKITYFGPVQSFQSTTSETIYNQLQFSPNPYLISLVGKVIKIGTITYNDMLPYLDPPDYVIRQSNSKRAQLALMKISKCFTLDTEQIEDSKRILIQNQENVKFQGQFLHSSKFALIAYLVQSNNWTDFVQVWAPYKGKIDLLFYQPLLRNLLNLIEWVIEPLVVNIISFQRYFIIQKQTQKFQHDGSIKQKQQLRTLDMTTIKELANLISYVGSYVGFRPKLFIKLCRIFKTIVKQCTAELKEQIKKIIYQYLMPGSFMVENNGPLSIQFYNLLDCFEYQFRYSCYLHAYKEGMNSCPYVARIFQAILRRQNIIVNNLSKQNKKLFTRRVAKLTHNQALSVFYWITRRIVMADYQAVVPEIVAVLNNSTPLTLDMAIFVMLYTLNQHRQPSVNVKTRQFQPWFKNITTFISNFFRRYLQTDIQPVFDYIIMKTGLPISELQFQSQLPGVFLKLLHQIFNKMHGSVMIQDLDKKKIDILAVGPRLQFQMLELASEVRAAKKSKVILQKFFWQQNVDHHCGYSLFFNLIVLLTQKRAQVLNKFFIDDLKIIGQTYDEYTLLIMQIIRILFYQAQDFNHYSLLLPKNPISLLLSQYKIPVQIVCEIVRPGIKHIATMNGDQWMNIVRQFFEAYQNCLKDPQYLIKSIRPNERVQKYLGIYKQKVVDLLPSQFFTAFWFLTLDSIYFPAKIYTQKIQQLKKKIDQNNNKKNDRNDRDFQRMKTLHQKLIKEEESQRKKNSQTLSQENLKKIQIDILKGDRQKSKGNDKKQNWLLEFAQMFVQACLLPRMMLDRAEAFYCVKFTIEMIKTNKMASTKSIRLLTYLIQYVMAHLPFTTQNEASNCIALFLSEILSIFNNWNDSVKLKQDLKRILGVQDNPNGKDNYNKLRQYLVRLFERVGNAVRSIRQEPYIIKNTLYLLEKVDSIPCYKQQAEELETHMKELKQLYSQVDMRTILDRQIAILGNKKIQLPEKPDQKKSNKPVANANEMIPQQSEKKNIPEVSAVVNPSTTPVNIVNLAPIIPINVQLPPQVIQNNPMVNKNSGNSHSRSPINSTPPPQNNGSRFNNNDQRNNNKYPEQKRDKSYDRKETDRNKNTFQSRFSDNKPADKKIDIKQKIDIKNKEEITKTTDNSAPSVVSVNPSAVSVTPSAVTVGPQFYTFTEAVSTPGSALPPLKTVKDLKLQEQRRQQQQQKKELQVNQQSSVSAQNSLQPSVDHKDNSVSAKPSQQETKKQTTELNLKNQRLPSFSTNAQQQFSKLNLLKAEMEKSNEQQRIQNNTAVELKQQNDLKSQQNNQEVQEPQSLKDINKKPQEQNKEVKEIKESYSQQSISKKSNVEFVKNQRSQNRKSPSRSPNPRKGSQNRDNKFWDNKEKKNDNKQREKSKLNISYTHRDRKSQERRQDVRREDSRREDSRREDSRRQDKRERQKDKEREKRHDKHNRSRSREKYGRR